MGPAGPAAGWVCRSVLHVIAGNGRAGARGLLPLHRETGLGGVDQARLWRCCGRSCGLAGVVGDGDGDRLGCGEQAAARTACSRYGYLVVVVAVGVGGVLVVRGDCELQRSADGVDAQARRVGAPADLVGVHAVLGVCIRRGDGADGDGRLANFERGRAGESGRGIGACDGR